MKIEIRSFHPKDFPEIASWWEGHGEIGPAPGMMIPDGTFVLDVDGRPALSITVLLTQSRALAYLEGYVSRPGLDRELRRELSGMLFLHACAFARSRGYRNAIMYTHREKLASRYEALGMTRSPLPDLKVLWKEL